MPATPLHSLAVVPVGDLVLHEAVERRRADAVRDGIRRSGVLTDPIVAAPAPDGRWLVLDGAHRTTALAELGLSAALIQVMPVLGLPAANPVASPPAGLAVPDPRHGARLDAWAHDVAGVDLGQLVGVRTGVERADGAGSDRAVVATVSTVDRVVEVWSAPDLPARLAAMWALARRYAQLPYVRRHPGDPGPTAGSVRVSWASARPEDLVALAATGATFPAGVSRFVVSGRVLGVRVPLAELTAAAPDGVVDEVLADRLLRRLSRLPARLYAEPVWVVESAPPITGAHDALG